MAERVLAGRPASPGRASGPAWRLDPPARSGAAGTDALAALEAAAAELDELAARLGGEEGEIVATGALMARDPALADAVRGGTPLEAAIEHHASALAALGDPMLAARADDVRSVGRRALRILSGAAAVVPPGAVVVATDAGPADVIELAETASAFALAGGGETAHAAIVARSLGLPMAACLGDAILAASGDVVVDGDSGEAVLEPGAERLAAARAVVERRRRARERALADRDLPAVTLDGERVVVLANIAGAAEVRVALDAGAEGAGLVRTELSFLDAPAWPTEPEHRRALEPILTPLAGRTATVRVLDFGGDKTPPFLGPEPRGIALLLAAPEALDAQLRAILAAGAATDLRIMLPLVSGPEDVERVRAMLPGPALLGAMIETPEAADRAAEIASVSDFLSVGTNDLTAATLGVDRFDAGQAVPHDPRVLGHIAAVVRAAAGAGIPVEVCGEAASDPRTLALLVGLGVGELSVGAARVGMVRAWIRELRRDEAHAIALAALGCASARSVAALVAPLARRLELLERGDDGGELVEGRRGVVPVGRQA